MRKFLSSVFLAAAMMSSGCSTTGYYAQAIRGEWQVLSRAKPIANVLANPSTSPEVQRKLELVLRLREFARDELHLPVDGHYLNYADLHRRYVVWNVRAAPKLSLESKRWWFPFVGRASYRGYFSEEAARAYAHQLAIEGWEVSVEGVAAYSTIGWFHDPVLNTFVNDSDQELAELLFHELTHQVIYLRSDTDFSEAFATAAAEFGVERWLRSSDQHQELDQYIRENHIRSEFTDMILQSREKLRSIYAGPDPDLVKMAEKEGVFAWLRQHHERAKQTNHGISAYDKWFSHPLNNARLNSVATYYELVPGFRRLWRENNGDFQKFFAAVRKLSKQPLAERQRILLGNQQLGHD